MSTPTTRRRRALWWLVGYVVVRVAVTLLFRSHAPRAVDAVRRFNRRVLNPAMLRLAGRPHWYAARLEHVGRRSGRRYATPVVARPLRDGLAVPLPYGTGVDWLRNVLAAGGASIVVGGERHVVTAPRVVDTAEIGAELPPLYRWMSRQYAIRSWLLVTDVG